MNKTRIRIIKWSIEPRYRSRPKGLFVILRNVDLIIKVIPHIRIIIR